MKVQSPSRGPTDIADRLRGLGPAQYEAAFRDNDIDADILLWSR